MLVFSTFRFVVTGEMGRWCRPAGQGRKEVSPAAAAAAPPVTTINKTGFRRTAARSESSDTVALCLLCMWSCLMQRQVAPTLRPYCSPLVKPRVMLPLTTCYSCSSPHFPITYVILPYIRYIFVTPYLFFFPTFLKVILTYV